MFWNTVSRGKMLVRWNDRAILSRQISCGGKPVISRPFSVTDPASGRRCPVMRLKTVVLPAPFGPMIAQMDPLPTVRSTPATAWKPSNAFRTPRTSSTPGSSEPAAEAAQRPDDAARKREQQDDEQRAEDERPVLRVRRDLLVQHE